MRKRKKNSKSSKDTAWFPKAWKQSQKEEVIRKANEIKYLVGKLYDIIYKQERII